MASAMAGSVRAFTAGQNPASQPGNPPADTQCSAIAKNSTSSIPSQKFGTARPSCVMPLTIESPRRPRLAAAYKALGKAMAMESSKAYTASGNDTCSRSASNALTGMR